MPTGIAGYCKRPIKNVVTGDVRSLGGDAQYGLPFMFAEHQRLALFGPCGPAAIFFERRTD